MESSVVIHPTAVLEGRVEADSGVYIGPFCVLRGEVKIGAGTRLLSNVSIGTDESRVIIGNHNEIYAGAVIGGPPQDLSYKKEKTSVEIGDRNVIREYVTINAGTQKSNAVTRVGSKNYLMTGVHVGHDAILEDDIVIANDCHLGGHTWIESEVVIGGVCAFNQFTRIGKCAFVAGGSIVNKDVLPFSKAQGSYLVMRASNRVGMLRRGYSPDEVELAHKAIRLLLKGQLTVHEWRDRLLREFPENRARSDLLRFLTVSKRGLAIPSVRGDLEEDLE